MDRDWTFFSNHGFALLQVARHPDSRIRDIADALGVTERAAQGIVGDLVREGYLERIREGRRNRYLVRGDRRLRHPLTQDYAVSEVLDAVAIGDRRPRAGGCEALVLGCSDYRIQGWLRSLLADQRLLDRAEVLLIPGGGAILAGTEREPVYELLGGLVGRLRPRRFLLVAHSGCEVPGVRSAAREDPLLTFRTILRRQRRIITEVRRRLEMNAELWFVDPGRFTRVRAGEVPAMRRTRTGLELRAVGQ
jgi:hypothetical protein